MQERIRAQEQYSRKDTLDACSNVGRLLQLFTLTIRTMFTIRQVTQIIKEKEKQINDRDIYINEHLPKIDAELKNEANKQGFIISTNNCKDSVLVSKANNRIGYHRIKYTSDLANVPNAIKRKDVSNKRKLEKDNDGKSICSSEMKRFNQQYTRTVTKYKIMTVFIC